MDGTAFATSRPSEERGDLQRSTFNVRHHHSIEIMAIVAPDGLCYGAHGSLGTNDLGSLKEANAAVHFAQLGDFKVLGDAIFHNTSNTSRVPNAAEASTRDSKEVKSIQGVRASVEHFFTFKNRFAYFKFSPKLKLNTMPFMHLLNSIFLQNIAICIHGNQVSQAFNMDTPCWEDYIQDQHQYNQVE